MDTEKKIPVDVYKTYGELFGTKTVSQGSEPVNSTTMMSTLQNVRGLGSLDDTKINSLLHAIDDL